MYAGPRPKPLPSISVRRDLDPPTHLQAEWRKEDEAQARYEDPACYGMSRASVEECVEHEPWELRLDRMEAGENRGLYDLEGRVF
jgi:hypothetical protein